jgi:hypothetical protein
MRSVLSARGLRKSFGELEVVCGVDLEVARASASACSVRTARASHHSSPPGLADPDAGDIELLVRGPAAREA